MTKDVTLPTAGANEVTIAWTETSDDSNAIAIAETASEDGNLLGTITRPSDMNTEITLTATLTKGDVSDTKEFTFTVIIITDEDVVTQAKDSLTIGYAQGDSSSRVTKDITLPLMGAGNDGEDNGVIIAWDSNNEAVINSGTGVVTEPLSANMKVEVTLTATLTKNNASDTRTFILTVLSRVFAWSQVALAEGSSIWSGRTGSGAAVFGGKIWVMGGNDGSRKNDVWSSSDGAAWTNANARGPAVDPSADPVVYNEHWSARSGHAAVVLGDKIWILGGVIGRRARANDVWSSSDGTDWTQTTVMGTQAMGTHWSARQNHVAVTFNNEMWVLGGSTGTSALLNDVWSSRDGATWANANARGPAVDPSADPVVYNEHWSARSGHAVVTFNGKIWVMGGYTGGTDYKNDVWSSSDGTDWAETTVTGTHWSARSNHAALVFADRMWVLGGLNRSGPNDTLASLNDVWWSSDGATWTKLDNGMSHWSARNSHAAVALGDKMWVLGGTDGNNLNSVWVYQQTSN